MTDLELDAFLEATATLLGLPVEPAWKAAVRANLIVTLRMAELVLAFPLDDEAEPAPIFTA